MSSTLAACSPPAPLRCCLGRNGPLPAALAVVRALALLPVSLAAAPGVTVYTPFIHFQLLLLPRRYRMIENAHAFVPCADQLGLEGLLLPPGWELRAVANLTQVGWGCGGAHAWGGQQLQSHAGGVRLLRGTCMGRGSIWAGSRMQGCHSQSSALLLLSRRTYPPENLPSHALPAPQGDGTPALPMVFLLGNQVNNQLLFLVRATVTPAEWSTNFEINHVRAAASGCTLVLCMLYCTFCGRVCVRVV